MRLGLLLVLFFSSGACGLIYQVLWLRLLSLVFGVTVYAASTVLAAFMAGLALGSVLAGPILMRVRRPLFLFGCAEILIGLTALITPAALDAASALYARLSAMNPDSFALLTTARLAASFAVLLVPTMLMGLTLPVLSASSLVRGAHVGSRVSALYAVNTAGAVVGALAAGFYLIGALGIQRSFFMAATVNVIVGVSAMVLGRRADTDSAETTTAEAARPPSRSGVGPRRHPDASLIGTVVAISGFAALALEIVWFRLLVQFLTATTYAFTTMLATVLLGIALGGGLSTRLLRRERDWRVWLALLQVATAIAVVGSAMFFMWIYRPGARTAGMLIATASAILPASFLMGMNFPIAIHIAGIAEEQESVLSVARRVGRLYSLNVLGAIGGALFGGFLVLPLLGARRALIALAALYGGSAILVVIRHPRRMRLYGVIAAAAVAFGVIAVRLQDPFMKAHASLRTEGMRELWRDEGVQTVVSVYASAFRRSLYLDGLHQANDTPGMVRVHRVIGHLPMVLHSLPKDVLVIGLGGGATSGAVSQHGARVQIVELSQGVRAAAVFFRHVNYDVVNQPNVRVRVDDGRNFLALSGQRFDVITADIIQPVHAGAGNVYSREYFTLVRNALKEHGIVLQWIGHREATQYRLIMRTFLDVFPDATVWQNGALMVGSPGPLRITAGTIAAKRADPRIAATLDEIGLTSFDTLREWYTAGADEMRQFVGPGLLLTDDRPLVEYHRSLPSDDPPIDVSTLRGDVAAIVR